MNPNEQSDPWDAPVMSDYRRIELLSAEVAKLRTALASQQPAAVSSAMVDRFLTWPVPADVRPDGTTGKPGRTGTNLLTAQQARIMLEHVLAVPPSERLEHGVTTAQAMEAVDALEAAARGDEPYSHFAGALIRSALLASSPAQPPAPPAQPNPCLNCESPTDCHSFMKCLKYDAQPPAAQALHRIRVILANQHQYSRDDLAQKIAAEIAAHGIGTAKAAQAEGGGDGRG